MKRTFVTRRLPWLVHLARVAVLAGLFFVIHLQHDRLISAHRASSISNTDFSNIQASFPNAKEFGESERHGGRIILSSAGDPLGYAIQTAPDSDRFLGFSGPTNLLVAFDDRDRIVGIHILSSHDTRDHVELIRKQPEFFESWYGLSWSAAVARSKVDGVSGATLTSYAMVQGLQSRLGASEVSRKFPALLSLDDAKQLFPNAAYVEQDQKRKSLWHVFDQTHGSCGEILRTSPAADEVIGYQGPTETRLAIGPDGHILAIAIAASFDNEPYVGYVRDDKYFAKLVKKYTLSQWSQLELDRAGIEGISGATMTSQAVANGIIETAKRFEIERHQLPSSKLTSIARVWPVLSTMAIIVIGAIIGLTSLRGYHKARVAFQVLVIVYLGLINGDLLSIAMFKGWAQSGIPWTNALGLVVLASAAIVMPIVAGTNLYCSHLCPHGAVQQLLPRRWKHQTPLPRWVVRTLSWIRPLLIVWVVLVCLLQWPFNLVDIEPFDAYAWRAAAWPTLLVATIGIVASLRVPMGYCQYGCVTGSVFQYIRRNSKSHRLTGADYFALTCLTLGAVAYVLKFPQG
ncbi:MAG: FMN-binding protein [Pirellulaceae bacterium]|nr:FMN-binding protein [Pirellulaceae bacterium]